MREAFLTIVTNAEPEPPTMAEALAAIERSRALFDEAAAIQDQARKTNSGAYELLKKAQNYPFGIMRTLGFVAGQVRQHVETREEVVVMRVNDGIADAAINGLTKKRTVLHNDSRRIDPQTAAKWADTGRSVKPDWQGKYYGRYVARQEEVDYEKQRASAAK